MNLCAKSFQLYPTLCNSMNCSLSGSSVHGISQARMLEWVAFPSPGHLPNPGIEAVSLMSPALVGGFFTTSATWEAHVRVSQSLNMIFSESLFLTFAWKRPL